MKELKPGDKIVAYNGNFRRVGIVAYTIGSQVCIQSPDSFSTIYHRKQIRLLKPKKPLREFWINHYKDDCLYLHTKCDDTPLACKGRDFLERIHVREVRPAKKQGEK